MILTKKDLIYSGAFMLILQKLIYENYINNIDLDSLYLMLFLELAEKMDKNIKFDIDLEGEIY